MDPARNARTGAASPALGRTVLLAGLASLTLLALAAPANALMVQPRYSFMVTDGVGIGVGVDPSDPSHPVTAQACIQHDSWWDELPRAGSDGGDTAVWVPIPPDSSMGSEKATTACLGLPAGSAASLPWGAKVF
jgi:hypothetical protein